MKKQTEIITIGNIYPSGGEAGKIVDAIGIYPTVKQGKRGGKAGMPIIRVPSGGWHQPVIMNTITEATGNRAGSSEEFKKSCKRIYDAIGEYRRLSPLEAERLQGFPDNWTQGVSDTQRYRQMGNAVTVNVIEFLGRRIVNNIVGNMYECIIDPS